MNVNVRAVFAQLLLQLSSILGFSVTREITDCDFTNAYVGLFVDYLSCTQDARLANDPEYLQWILQIVPVDPLLKNVARYAIRDT